MMSRTLQQVFWAGQLDSSAATEPGVVFMSSAFGLSGAALAMESDSMSPKGLHHRRHQCLGKGVGLNFPRRSSSAAKT